MTVRRWISGFVTAVAVLAAWTSSLAAQDPAERRELRQQVIERFIRNYQTQAGLADEQAAQFQQVLRQSMEANAKLQQRERSAWRALEGQMRPGVAANGDSVIVLLDALVQVAQDRVEQLREDQQAYAEFLAPVQRAQLTLAWRRLQNQIQPMQRRRRPEPGPPPRHPDD